MTDAQNDRLPIGVLENVFVSIEVRIAPKEHTYRGNGTASVKLDAFGSGLEDLGDRLGPSIQPLVDAAFQDYLEAQAREREKEAEE